VQATSLGRNLTGTALTPAAVQAMNDAADALSPAMEIDTSEMDARELEYIAEADAVGSVPPPLSATAAGAKAAVKTVVKALTKPGTAQPAILMDKLGERLAFERSGARLYDAFIRKVEAARQLDPQALPPAQQVAGDGAQAGEDPMDTLLRIRADELEHFQLLCEAVTSLGGDPTAMTPCADVTAVASSGIMQVLNDPRTTLAQCLSAMLTAELTDNAGWELLIGLAESAGQPDLVGPFLAALGQEQEHLEIVKGWLTTLVSREPVSPTV
jgi:hypothetical protein